MCQHLQSWQVADVYTPKTNLRLLLVFDRVFKAWVFIAANKVKCGHLHTCIVSSVQGRAEIILCSAIKAGTGV
jgi:hypothetical protein